MLSCVPDTWCCCRAPHLSLIMYQIRPVRNTKDRQKAPSVTLTWIRNYSLDECWSKFWSSWLVYLKKYRIHSIPFPGNYDIWNPQSLNPRDWMIWNESLLFFSCPVSNLSGPCPIYLAHVQFIWPISRLFSGWLVCKPFSQAFSTLFLLPSQVSCMID